MRHWYLLARCGRRAERRASVPASSIIARAGDGPCDSLSSAGREKMFWLGLIEAVPLFTGGIFAADTDSALKGAGFAIAGVAVSILACWCLRHQTPDTRVEFSMQPKADGERA